MYTMLFTCERPEISLFVRREVEPLCLGIDARHADTSADIPIFPGGQLSANWASSGNGADKYMARRHTQGDSPLVPGHSHWSWSWSSLRSALAFPPSAMTRSLSCKSPKPAWMPAGTSLAPPCQCKEHIKQRREKFTPTGSGATLDS